MLGRKVKNAAVAFSRLAGAAKPSLDPQGPCAHCGGSLLRSSDDFVHQVAGYVGEAEVAAAVPVSQLGVVETEQV